jgi:hypothetical protein
MSIKITLGMWIASLGMSMARIGLDMVGVRPSDLAEDDSIIIHNVLEGPFTQYDLPDEWQGPYEAEAYLVVKAEVDGEIKDIDWYFETIEEAFVWVKHFKSSIKPIVIEGGDYE